MVAAVKTVPLELGFVDGDGRVEPVVVDAQVRVESVVFGVSDGDDPVVRADPVAAGEVRLSFPELDVAAVTFHADDRVLAPELVTLLQTGPLERPVVGPAHAEESVLPACGRDKHAGRPGLRVDGGRIGNPDGTLAKVVDPAEQGRMRVFRCAQRVLLVPGLRAIELAPVCPLSPQGAKTSYPPARSGSRRGPRTAEAARIPPGWYTRRVRSSGVPHSCREARRPGRGPR